LFITFEGIDLSGKSSQAKLLYSHLKKKKKKVLLVREPGGTIISEKIRKILLDKKNTGMYPMTEYLLFSSSRCQLTEEIIRPHLKKGYYVICDRYYDSSTAYQGYGGEVNLKTINKINLIATDNLKPDITFFIDVPLRETVRRRKKSGRQHDRMESKAKEYYGKVIKGFRSIARINKKRYIIIDGEKAVKEVHKEIVKKIEKYIK